MIKMPGIGSYTSAAIRSIVFSQPSSAIDGNFIRVFSRLIGIKISDKTNRKNIQEIVKNLCDSIIEDSRPGDFNQAVMDIANLLCFPKAKPKCHICPLSYYCQAFSNSG
ncbi:hypothetical protein MXB_405, partial [Myxobolus squamalis]